MGGTLGKRWTALAIVGLGAAVAAGCGGNGASSTTSSATQAPAANPAPKIKPDEDLAAICPQLALRTKELAEGLASSRPGRLHVQRTRSLHLTGCRFETEGVNVHLAIDSAPEARQRYSNRMVESYQFGSGVAATSTGLRPRPVKGLGDRNVGGGGANWLPIYNQLLSVRGPRVLIVNFFARGGSDGELKAAAIALSREAYSLLGAKG
ncbi:MAG TPA: hypothetical protein VH391_05360 [Solirubrobacterales bacterium]